MGYQNANFFSSAPEGALELGSSTRPIICFSHLRWDFVFQRPQHIMSRLATFHRVFFFEEPKFEDVPSPMLRRTVSDGVTVLTPIIPLQLHGRDVSRILGRLVSAIVRTQKLQDAIAWYYTPMALRFTSQLEPAVTVYDCMDELSAFAGAPSEIGSCEAELFRRADIVFTGGRALYEAKANRHDNVHCFRSGVDAQHFAPKNHADPLDQRALSRPRLGFYGVLDERFDAALVERVAQARPEWNIVLVGPVVKIEAESLPRSQNITYLPQKTYAELPAYLSNWDIAILPFARNAATRFISPTKTLEYLAAEKPVISTPIADVVEPYGRRGIVQIASTAEEFVMAGEQLLASAPHTATAAARNIVKENSWDHIVQTMMWRVETVELVERELAG